MIRWEVSNVQVASYESKQTDAYLEPSVTSMMEIFWEKPLTIPAKGSDVDIGLGCKYAPGKTTKT